MVIAELDYITEAISEELKPAHLYWIVVEFVDLAVD